MTHKTRILKELRERDKSDLYSDGVIWMVNDDAFYNLTGTIKGPAESPYEGGIFELEILVPTDYPFKPPVIKFRTRIWHPNISSDTGQICLDILQENWNPALVLTKILLSIQAMLSSPNFDNPLDDMVAQLSNHKDYTEKAKHWTGVYASKYSILM